MYRQETECLSIRVINYSASLMMTRGGCVFVGLYAVVRRHCGTLAASATSRNTHSSCTVASVVHRWYSHFSYSHTMIYKATFDSNISALQNHKCTGALSFINNRTVNDIRSIPNALLRCVSRIHIEQFHITFTFLSRHHNNFTTKILLMCIDYIPAAALSGFPSRCQTWLCSVYSRLSS